MDVSPEIEAKDLPTLLELEPSGEDRFLAVAAAYPWGRVYGGLVIAQGLVAAGRTVDEKYRIHSVHGYFIRGGSSEEKIDYDVDRIRDGRSFCTRRVVARQTGGAILNLSASFQVPEAETVHAQALEFPAGVPSPDELPTTEDTWSRVLENKPIPSGMGHGRAQQWIRIREPLEDASILHPAGLAYASDDLPIDAVSRAHPSSPPEDSDRGEHHEIFMAASLDHAIWFHRPFRADQWLLHDVRSSGVYGGRGLAIAEIFDQSGAHVATVTQECLLRERMGG